MKDKSKAHLPGHWYYSGKPVGRRRVGYEVDKIFGGPPGEGESPPGVIALCQFAYEGTNASGATIYEESGAIVFATGSMQFAWGLDNYNADPNLGPVLRPQRSSEAAKQMVRNLFIRFLGL